MRNFLLFCLKGDKLTGKRFSLMAETIAPRRFKVITSAFNDES